MKKDQLNLVKDKVNSTIYKTVEFTSYLKELTTIVRSHYSLRAHFAHWGCIFTANELRPELNMDYSEILAKMVSLPGEKKAIFDILEKNSPDCDNLDNSCDKALVEIYSYLLTVGYDSRIIITHHILKSWLHKICVSETVHNKITCRLFKISSPYSDGFVFERDYEASTSFLDSFCDMFLNALGWKSEWNERSDDVYLCAMTIQEINPFKSLDIDQVLDDHIFFVTKLVRTLSPYQRELKVA